MQVGDLVRYKDRWLDTIGLIVKEEDEEGLLYVAWNSRDREGQVVILGERLDELELLR